MNKTPNNLPNSSCINPIMHAVKRLKKNNNNNWLLANQHFNTRNNTFDFSNKQPLYKRFFTVIRHKFLLTRVHHLRFVLFLFCCDWSAWFWCSFVFLFLLRWWMLLLFRPRTRPFIDFMALYADSIDLSLSHMSIKSRSSKESRKQFLGTA